MKILSIFFLSLSLIGTVLWAEEGEIITSPGGAATNVDSGADDTPQGFGLTAPARKKKKKGQTKKKRKKGRKANDEELASAPKAQKGGGGNKFGIGVEGGWEAPYGNGVTAHFILNDFLDLNGGVGYNNSGLKIGGGAHLLISLGPAFSLRFGASIVSSQGRSGDVSLEAKFTPEGASSSETIEASKDFEVSGALMASPSAGIKLALGDSMAIIGGGNYNVILSGNEVKYKEDIRYNKNVELTNENDFDKEFEDEAKGLVQAGGLGFHVGIMILM